MRRQILLCPGPVNTTSEVRRALLRQDLCHREPEFSVLLQRVRRNLLKGFGVASTHTVGILSGSGTAALEAAVIASTRPGRALLVVDNGVYGARMAQIAKVHGIRVIRLTCPILQRPALARIEAALRRHTAVDAVGIVHHETSTGLLNPVDEVARAARRRGQLVLVDAISSLGAEPLNLRTIDLCVGSAGKCLHAYPGLSFVLVSKRARARMKAVPMRSLYLDLRTLLDAQDAGPPPFTPAVQLIQGLDAALEAFLREGLKTRITEYQRRAVFLRSGFARIGLTPLLPAALQCHTLTALRLPPGLSYERLHDLLKRDGFVIYAGQSRLRREIFRIAHMGALTFADMRRLLRSLERWCG